jgi:hypothetical protein
MRFKFPHLLFLFPRMCLIMKGKKNATKTDAIIDELRKEFKYNKNFIIIWILLFSRNSDHLI